jgi:ABC-type multidrug transport system permease subunit
LSSHFGALVIVMIMSMFGNAQTALLAFPMERPMFLREYSTNHYSALAYFISRFTVEVCSCALEMLFQASITYAMIGFQASFGLFYVSIFTCTLTTIALAVLVGCFIEDTKLGQEMLNLLVMPQVLFSGFFIAPNMIPVWLRWAQYACTLTYSLRIIMVYEFGNCGTGVKDIIACTNLLDNLNADSDHVWMYWTILMCFFVVFRLSGLYVLKKKATKFL